MSEEIKKMLAAADGANHVGEYPAGQYCPMPNKVGTIHAVCDLDDVLELRRQRDELTKALEMLILFSKPTKSNAAALANAHAAIASTKGVK